jgi:transcriptional repressor of cell division inhibition gene dicB
MRKTKVIDHFGSLQAVADALDITVSAVSQWDDIVPEGSAYKIQVVTGGALRVDKSAYRNRAKRGQTLGTDAA